MLNPKNMVMEFVDDTTVLGLILSPAMTRLQIRCLRSHITGFKEQEQAESESKELKKAERRLLLLRNPQVFSLKAEEGEEHLKYVMFNKEAGAR